MNTSIEYKEVNSFDIVMNGFKELSMDLIKDGVTDADEAYNILKNKYFENDKLFDDCFKMCFNITQITLIKENEELKNGNKRQRT